MGEAIPDMVIAMPEHVTRIMAARRRFTVSPRSILNLPILRCNPALEKDTRESEDQPLLSVRTGQSSSGEERISSQPCSSGAKTGS